tara:strand:- start:118 stop:642 length:525 start_codon:yes stop_codon:yes gene_type:complete
MTKTTEAEYHEGRIHKSELFKAAKDAQALYDLIADDDVLEDWVAEKIRLAAEFLEMAYKYVEYDKMFPEMPEPSAMIDEDEERDKNNYLSNEDKRYPTPMDAENGDGFVSRCLVDPNMKNRYPEQSDRFMACMLIWKEVGKPGSEEVDNPGEQFEDPMELKEEELKDPTKPVLP